MSEKINAEEYLADKICREELGQEPDDSNLNFRKTLVHGMVKWQEEYASQSRTTLTLEEEQVMDQIAFPLKHEPDEYGGFIEDANEYKTIDLYVNLGIEHKDVIGNLICRLLNAEQERREK